MKTSKQIFYIPDEMSLYVNEEKYPDLIIDDVEEIERGIIVLDHSFQNTGVYYPDGQLCAPSILQRYEIKDILHKYKKHISIKQYIDEEVIYIGTGYMFEHFGHFLIEGTSRLWPLLYPKYKNMKVAISLKNRKDIPSFVRKMLNALGVLDSNIIIVNKNTQFAKVFIPHQSSIVDVNILPITKQVFDKIASELGNENIQTYEKIYLSRGAMNDGRTFGEAKIENMFAKNGYKIIYPEKLPLEQQITLAHCCKELAGTAGSALHLAFFMKPGGRVIQIKRNSNNSDNINIQNMIGVVSHLETVLIYGSIETHQTEHFTLAPQIIGVTPQMIRFFNDNGFEYDESDLTPDNAEFEKYKNQLKKYTKHQKFIKIMNFPIRVISLFGITKQGRECVREFLRSLIY